MGMILAGSSVVTGKILLAYMPVFLSQFIGLIISLVCIVPFAWVIEGNPFKISLSKKDLIYLFLQALTGMFLFRIFLMEGLKRMGAIEAGIITSMTPLVLAILSVVMLKERISLKGKIGILLCIIGIVFINQKNAGDSIHSNSLLGILFVFLAVTGEALFSIFRKKLSYEDRPITSTAIIILISLLLFAPIGLRELSNSAHMVLSLELVVTLLYYGIFCTVIAYICWFSGISEIKASIAAGFTALMPVASIVLSVVLLGETLQIKHVIGAIIVLLGIVMITGITIPRSTSTRKD